MRHLQTLRLIQDVARIGSIRKAAEDLAITSSALNRRIQRFEEEFGAQIFERVPRGVRLNPAGELLMQHIRGQMTDLERIRGQVADLSGERRGHVTIACSQALNPSFLPEQIARYRGRISGPLLDRIDLQVEVPRTRAAELRGDAPPGEASAEVRARVLEARQRQLSRSGVPNSQLGQRDLSAHCSLEVADQALLERAVDKLRLSARAHQRILRVARTIADLAGVERIGQAHLTEAIAYRRMERANS